MIEKCPKCGAPMIILYSQNSKECIDNLKHVFEFNLKPKQQPLIKAQR